MSQPAIQDLPPEVLDAFFGKAPLESAQPHFNSRLELLTAYTNAQAATFGPETVRTDKCDLCGTIRPPAGQLRVIWYGRVSWNKRSVILVVLLSPLLLTLALSHIGIFIVAWALKGLELDKQLEFVTVHPLCHRCIQQLRWRRAIHGFFLFIFGFTGVVSGIAAVILSAIMVAALFRICGLGRNDIQDLFVPWILCVSCATAVVLISRIVGKRLLFPRTVHQLVKRPFAYRTYELIMPTRVIKPL
jgi:hypothetical protein